MLTLLVQEDQALGLMLYSKSRCLSRKMTGACLSPVMMSTSSSLSFLSSWAHFKLRENWQRSKSSLVLQK